jgi:hypothetical protein
MGEGSTSEPDKEKLFSALIEEYRALRSEQQKRFEAADRAFHYLVIIGGAIVAGFLQAYSKSESLHLAASVLLIAPLLVAPLVLNAINNEIMVVRLGMYLFNVMRPRIVAVTRDPAIWNWEAFHVEESRSIFFRLSGLSRRFAYIVPPLIPMVGFMMLQPRPFSRLQNELLGVDIALAALIFVLLVYASFVFKRAVPPACT